MWFECRSSVETDMGQCNVEDFSGSSRRKRRKLVAASSSSDTEVRTIVDKRGNRGRPPTNSNLQRRRGCLCAIILCATLFVSLPAAVQGDSLEPDSIVGSVRRTSSSTDGDSQGDNSPTSFYFLQSTPATSATTSTATANVEPLTTTESFLFKSAESSSKFYASPSSSSSSTPSERVIRSSSAHSFTVPETSPSYHHHSSTSSSSSSALSSIDGNNIAGGPAAVVTVTEPIRDVFLPSLSDRHTSRNNHHESVHSRNRPRQLHESYVKPAAGSDPEAQAKQLYNEALQEFGVTGQTLGHICEPWEEKGCKCTGSVEEVSLNCHAVSFDGVPHDLPDNLGKLDLSATNISMLLNNAFANLHILEELSLAENQLLKIERNSFYGLIKLKRLVLSNCRLMRIPGESFKHLNSLNTLRLDGNELEHLDEDSFQFVPNLRKLGLNKNHINTLPRQILATFASSLQILNLANNRITLIDDNDFPRMDQLAVISLKRNRISKVSDGAFRNLPKLRILDLDDNFLTAIPGELRTVSTLQELSLSNNRIHWILDEDLPRSLTSFEVRANPLKNIQSRAFRNFTVLRKIVLSDAKNLVELPSLDGSPAIEILRVDRASLSNIPESLCETSPRLKSLELKSNKLHRVPNLHNCRRLRVLDLSGNKIRSLHGRPFQSLVELHDLVLSYNEIPELRRDSFDGLKVLQSLDLEGNVIGEIERDTFAVFERLEDLNLGKNIFPKLPTAGLQKLLHLKTFNNPKLREFPPPDTFPRIQTLVLSYAYHCCAFQPLVALNSLLSSHNLQESVLFPSDTDFDMSLWNNSLADIWPQLDNLSKKFGPKINELWDNFGSDFTYPGNMPSYVEEYFEEENAAGHGFRESASGSGASGFGDQYMGSVQCLPLPGPFLPCTDLFDWWTLRCGVWVVFLLAMLGNGTVVFVLVFSRSKMDVPRFLVCNLAAADFFMGVYLGILAVVDASTLGEFRMFAIPWQMSAGCQMAGFLAVLSSELSVYTLAVITLERNYAITHAMHLNKRLSLRHAGYIMAIGWAFALTMAILPLFGISDYRKFAVCLPFETTTGPGSLAYVVFLMFINGVAFLILMGCYLKMYCAIRGSQAWNSNDSRIAKRMALLVFTDFICWSPIAFLSLTAAFGLHLISLEQAKVFTVFILPLNSCCNPFLYAILTKQFKKDCVMICKAIEESRVTRGIGRCRHSSNFSNRHTPANTNSLVERSSKDATIVPGPPCGCTKLLEKPLDRHKFTPGHHNHYHHHSSFDVAHQQHNHNHHHHHNNHGYQSNHHHFRSANELDLEPDYRGYRLNSNTGSNLRRFWRRLFHRRGKNFEGRRNNRNNEYAYQIAEIQHKQQHKRAGSMSSSENFSSSRSDSWRHAPPHHCGIPLRLLDPRRRHSSWLVTRKTSQDSNLSSSRNDSSSTTVTNASTSTFRLSRSSGGSTPLPPLIVNSRNSIPGCGGGKPRLLRQTAMHEELSIDMSSSSSPPRLGVRFLPTIPSAADSSIILDDTDSGNDNGVEISQNGSSSTSSSDGMIVMATREENHEIVVNLPEQEGEVDENADESDDGLEMRLEDESLGGRTEKRGSGDSTHQAFYTVLGNGGSTLATLATPKDGGKPP